METAFQWLLQPTRGGIAGVHQQILNDPNTPMNTRRVSYQVTGLAFMMLLLPPCRREELMTMGQGRNRSFVTLTLRITEELVAELDEAAHLLQLTTPAAQLPERRRGFW